MANSFCQVPDNRPPGSGASAVPARGPIQSAPGGLRASSSPVLRPVREVLSLDWDRGVAGNTRRNRVPGSEAWS